MQKGLVASPAAMLEHVRATGRPLHFLMVSSSQWPGLRDDYLTPRGLSYLAGALPAPTGPAAPQVALFTDSPLPGLEGHTHAVPADQAVGFVLHVLSVALPPLEASPRWCLDVSGLDAREFFSRMFEAAPVASPSVN